MTIAVDLTKNILIFGVTGDGPQGHLHDFVFSFSARHVLRPAIAWSGAAPDAATLEDLHHQSHRHCYIANSIRAEVRVEPA